MLILLVAFLTAMCLILLKRKVDRLAGRVLVVEVLEGIRPAPEQQLTLEEQHTKDLRDGW